MSEQEAPLSAAHRALLDQRRDVEPPPGFEDALLARLHTSMAAPPAAPSAASGPSGASTALLGGVGVSALVVGVALGAVAGHAWWPGPTPEPVIVERVKTVEVIREVERPTPAPIPKRSEGKPTVTPSSTIEPSPDALLAEERQWIDVARSALLHGDPRAALESLGSHARRFPSGRLAEERQSLEVQALVLAGRTAEARQVAEAFHRTFPHSLLGPVVDAALTPE